MNKLTETAPPQIHLCIADDEDARHEAFPSGSEVTWADYEATAATVRYIRADLAKDPAVNREITQ